MELRGGPARETWHRHPRSGIAWKDNGRRACMLNPVLDVKTPASTVVVWVGICDYGGTHRVQEDLGRWVVHFDGSEGDSTARDQYTREVAFIN